MKLSIRTKMMGFFILIILGTSIVGWRGIVGMSDINRDLNSIDTEQFIPARTIANANAALIAWNRAVLNHVIAENVQKMDEFERIMAEQNREINSRLQQLSTSKYRSERGKVVMQNLIDQFRRIDPIRDRIVKLSRDAKQDEARRIV